MVASWLITWQDVYAATDYVLRVYEGKQLVAIGLWVVVRHQRPLGFHVNTLHLHHCGNDRKDQIWSEYNELLCLPAYRETVYRQLLNRLPDNMCLGEVDFGVSDATISPWLCHSGWLAEQRWKTASIGVDISQWSSFESYLTNLSKSFRYQLRRTEKGLQHVNNVTVQFAPNTASCIKWFQEDGKWHKAQWGDQSGFENPEFVAFHLAWIQRAFPNGHCHYVRLLVGDEVAAGAYLFSTEKIWYFYLGFSREDWGPKIKTGYYLHLKIIEHCFNLGIDNYDFMGGDYAYKRRFGQPQRQLVGNRYKPASWVNRFEQGLKLIKKQLIDRSNQ
ncbi:MAG: GNAT family N-acetyltransferase [Gammaproteobacteria bacterium]